jgi:hypothetical protein
MDFLDELRLFIEKKPIFTKKKNPSLCRLPSPPAVISWLPSEIFVCPIFERFFQVDLKNKFRRVAPI